MNSLLEKPMDSIEDPYIIKAIINGLFATGILWFFWVLFVTGIAVPLITAQVKGAVCTGIGMTVWEYPEDNPFIIFDLPMGGENVPAKNLINKDDQELKNQNFSLTLIFGLLSMLVILFCGYAIYSLIIMYNLDWVPILKFDLTMASIIIVVESLFFGLVAAQYVPFDLNSIAVNTKQKMIDYLQILSFGYVKPSPCVWSDPIPNTNSSGIVDNGLIFVTLDSAKTACQFNDQCAAVTQNGDEFTLRASATTTPSTSGETTWLLSGCR